MTRSTNNLQIINTMKKIYLYLSVALFAIPATAQTPEDITDDISEAAQAVMELAEADATAAQAISPWKGDGNTSINLSQTSLSNWNAGGDPSIAVNAAFNYELDYKKGKHLWTNRLELAYGINNTASNGTRKTNDKIYFSSNYGYLLASKLYISATATFNTQFAKGYDYAVSSTDYTSTFMAPGYLSGGIGLTYAPTAWLTLIISPATYRATFVCDDKLSLAGAFSVTPGKRLLNEFGANIRAEVNTTIWKKLSLYTRLDFYSNYLDKPQNIDVNWDIQLNYALTSWLTANLQVNMIYDDNILFGATDDTPGSPRLQIKEVLGIGLQANF